MPDASDSPLPAATSARVDEIGGADIVIGIPAFNNAGTVGHVAIAAEVGLRKLFPGKRAVICVSDGGSSDETRERAEAAAVGARAESLLVPPDTAIPEKVVFEYGGRPGKGSALRAVFEIASRLGASACAVMDADLRSITPYWIDRLLSPVVNHGYEFVAPLYVRHKYDGTITNAVAYPLTAALYGAKIRQPIGGDFCVSGDVARGYAESADWGGEVTTFGIDIWMTTSALTQGRRVCQTILGAKVHDPKEPGSDLAPMFRQVVGTLFELAVRHHDIWAEVDSAVTPPTFGFLAQASAEPVNVSAELLLRGFSEGKERWASLWQQVLSEAAFGAAEGGHLDAGDWVTVLYDYLVAFANGYVSREELIDSLIPLYFARTARFVEETRTGLPAEAELLIEGVVDKAVELKPYLIDRWASVRSAGTLSPS